MRVRHKLADCDALEFTQAMFDKNEPIPEFRIVLQKPLVIPTDENQSTDPILMHDFNGNSFHHMSPGNWIVISRETGTSMLYVTKKDMDADFTEVEEDKKIAESKS